MMCDGGWDESVEHMVLVCERYVRERERMVDVVRLEVGAWMNDANSWTTEERMRMLLGLGDRVSDAIVGDVKDFLDRVWRVRSSGGGGQCEADLGYVLLEQETTGERDGGWLAL